MGNISKNNKLDFVIRSISGRELFLLTPKVDGEIRPFSIAAYELEQSDSSSKIGNQILKIKHSLFWHNGSFYMMRNLPEGRVSDHLSGTGFISRLANFPFKNDGEIDPATWQRLHRYRGIEVGEMSGLGSTGGHKVKLQPELKDIGIPLSAASYLIYAMG